VISLDGDRRLRFDQPRAAALQDQRAAADNTASLDSHRRGVHMAQTQRDAHTIAAATRACPRHVPVLIHT
jgi:hypothetical protein